ELGQFLVVGKNTFGVTGAEKKTFTLPKQGEQQGKKIEVPTFTDEKTNVMAYTSTKDNVRRWYQGCLALERKLAAFGPLYSTDPAIQFCVQSARRNLGEIAEAKKWYSDFAARQPDGPWRQAARAELWL